MPTNTQQLFAYLQDGSLQFRPMVDIDFEGFAGAEEGSLIAENDEAVFILSPSGRLSLIPVGSDVGDEILFQINEA